MVIRKYLTTCLLLCLALLQACRENTSGTSSDESIELQLNFDKDSSFQYYIKNNVKIEQEADENSSINMNLNTTLGVTYRVVAQRSENTSVSVTYDRITTSIGNALKALEFDSDNDNGDDPTYSDLRDLVNKRFTMTVSKNGTVLSAGMIRRHDDTGANAYNLSDTSMRKVMLHALYIYPDKPVAPGDKWKRSYPTSVGFANVQVNNTYKLVSVKAGIAHIELQSKLTSENTQQAGNSTMNLSGVQSGFMDIEVKSGLVRNAKISQQLSGTMNITGKESPVTIESDIYIMGKKK